MPRSVGSLEARLSAGWLGTWAMAAIGIAAVTPVSVVAAGIPLGFGQVKQLGIPAGYATITMVLAVFVVGLSAMARHVPNSGAFYSYVAAGVSKPLGVGMGGVALVAYSAMNIGLYGAFGVAAAAAMRLFDINTGWRVMVFGAWLAISVLSQLRTRRNAHILGVFITAEVAIVVLFSAVMLTHPANGTVSFAALNPVLLASPEGAGTLVGAIAGLVGFEVPLAFAMLARDPKRTPRRAITLILLVVGVLYAGSAWAMTVIAGPDNIIAVAGEHPTDLFFYLPAPYLPTVVMNLAVMLFATSLFAAILAFHSTVARYALTLAREGVLPAWLARTRADEVPVTASAAQSAVALLALGVAVLLDLDPTRDLFFYSTVAGGLGVLILMGAAAIAVIRFFHRHLHAENLWRRRIAPITSAVLLLTILALTVAYFSELIGSTNPIKVWAPSSVYLTVIAVGAGWAVYLRSRRPDVYAVIGHGDRAALQRPTGPGLVPNPRGAHSRGRDDSNTPGWHSYLNR
ncbi:MAG TPA: APC family permease [Actinoplanes sp.]